MKTISLLSFCLTASITLSSGQDLPDLKAYRSDIGFNTNFVFSGIFNSGGNGNPFDLMLKKQQTSSTALRFGTRVSFNNYNDLSSPYQQGYNKYSAYSLSISVGKEFQKQITRRWIFYYGSDLATSADFVDGKNYSQNNAVPLTYSLVSENKSNRFGLAVIPFMGIRFAINDRLYVATQTNMTLLFNKKDAYQKIIDANNSTPGNNQYISSTKSFYENSLTLTPASGIFIFYRF